MRLLWLTLALAACSNDAGPAGSSDDAGPGSGSDAGSDAPGMPPPPALGAQLDRMGRAGVADVLIASLPSAGADPAGQKARYNQAADPATWKTTMLRTNVTVEAELMANIGMFDVLDLSLGTSAVPGCGNTLGFKPPVAALSYQVIADVLADDEIFIDTARATCSIPFALELERFTSNVHSTCGGRPPTQDAVDVLYSILMAGSDGLNLMATGAPPRVHGASVPHADTSNDTFPFLGAPSP
ncbi:MAG TPA: hypothetical protein VGC42_31880 [Kofleriaceae bacterium]